MYSNGESERILGKALKVHNIPRENVVIMTKVQRLLRRRAFIARLRGLLRYSVRFGMMAVQVSW